MTSPPRSLEDSPLWDAFRRGDELAYEELYRRFTPGLYSYGVKFCRQEELVRDCIQDLFVSLWDKRFSLKPVQSVRFYLGTALRNDLVRRLARQATVIELTDDHDFELTLDVQALRMQEEMDQHQVERLNAALGQLPPRQKEALYLRFYENLDYDQIASLMRISPGVSYNFVYRALLSMKKILLASSLLLTF
ncbi:MAG: sigma-70 family RNA polymerase sigma factor [Cytophagaceae bacterium]|nr:sigma-70 family RNA polymerase sigma factor [Cytophagaceae bacterium]